MEKNKISDYDLVLSQFCKMYNHMNKFKIFEDVKYETYREIKDYDGNVIYYEIGEPLDKITYDTYLERFNIVFENDAYSVLLNDCSFINIFYRFDVNKKLVYCSLNYVPCYECSDELKNNRYIRIDYEEKGHTEFTHPLSHMHITVNKNEIRLPIDHVVTPNEFIYFILVHVYHEFQENIKDLDLKSKLSSIVMSKEEMKKTRISFGEQ